MIILDKEYYVYEWYFIDSGEVFHVGKGKDKRAYEKVQRRNEYFKNIVSKYPNNVDVRIYKNNLTNDEACNLEKERIKYYKSIGQAKTNFHEGGIGGHTGNYFSPERSAKLRECMLKRDLHGDRNPMYGKTHTPEARAIISKANKGKKISPEQIERFIQYNKNRVYTEEERQKRRELATGVIFTEERKRNISLGLIKHEYTVLFNNTSTTIKGFKYLVKYMKDNYNISRTIVIQIIDGTWNCKFNRHKKFKDLKIIKTEIKCID